MTSCSVVIFLLFICPFRRWRVVAPRTSTSRSWPLTWHRSPSTTPSGETGLQQLMNCQAPRILHTSPPCACDSTIWMQPTNFESLLRSIGPMFACCYKHTCNTQQQLTGVKAQTLLRSLMPQDPSLLRPDHLCHWNAGGHRAGGRPPA
jgi:hypothetical protein